MKKITLFALSLLLCLCGIFFSACGEEQNVELTLSKSSVVIYYGEKEDNAETVNVAVSGKEVNALGLKYDNTFIKITSTKKNDGSFDLTISPKSKITTGQISVIVSAGGEVEARFTVMVIVPVERVTASDNQYIVFNGELTTYNLLSGLKFYPEGSGDYNVQFTIDNIEDFGEDAYLQNNQIVLKETFNKFDTPFRISALVVGEGISVSPSTAFNVSVIPNVRGLSYLMSMGATYNKADGAISADGYVLEIVDGELEEFSISIDIPTELGVGVDVDVSADEQNNIMQYLTCDKTSKSIKEGITTNTFIFKAFGGDSTTAKARLYFKFYYIDNDDEKLKSNFVICDDGLHNYVDISLFVPLDGIDVQTDADIYTNMGESSYVIYKNYNSQILQYGSIFKFLTSPLNASNKEFIIESFDNGVRVGIIESNGNFKALSVGDTITAGTNVYIMAKSTVADATGGIKFKLKSLKEESITKEIVFRVENGTNGLFIVDSTDVVPDYEYNIEDSTVNLSSEVNERLYLVLYAPNAKKSQLKYDNTDGDVVIKEIPGKPNYFQVDINTSKAGEINKTITKSINTLNGYSVTINVSIIQRILEDDVKVVLAKSSQNLSAIGYINDDYSTNGLKSINIKNGGSVELDLLYTEGALKPKIKYYYKSAQLKSEDYPDAYSKSYKDFNLVNLEGSDDFVEYCGVISSQNLINRNVITGVAEGKVYLRVDVIGSIVVDGKIIDAREPISVYFLVEVYNPVTEIVAYSNGHEVKNIELRAKNLVKEESDYTITLSLETLSGLRNATYDKLYLDGGIIGEDEVGFTMTREVNEDLAYSVVLNDATKELTITLERVPLNYDYSHINKVKIFAFDFGGINFQNGGMLNYSSIKSNYPSVEFTLQLTVLKTIMVDDVNVKSLKLLDNKNDIYKTFDSNYYKVYEEIYIDINDLTQGSDNLYRITTEILPANAYNKNLIYTFFNATGTSETLVTIPFNDGVLHMGAIEGGRGYIQIVPEAPSGEEKVKTIIIPIKIADGKSFDTAFEISDLSKVKNPYQHYILVGGQTYELNNTLIDGSEFVGGLYGRKNPEDVVSSIMLNNCSLFDNIGQNGIVKDLQIYGTSNASGMIANANKGTIDNVDVTTYIISGVYVPSVVFVSDEIEFAGGIVGTNKIGGVISNCNFAGSIVASKDALLVASNCGGIYGVNEEGTVNGVNKKGTVSGCKIIIAKYQFGEQTRNRVVVESATNYYINGIQIGEAGNTFVAGNNDEYILDKYSDHDDLGSIVIKTDEDKIHSIGKADSDYGIVFYYKARVKNNQSELNTLNIININDLISAENQDDVSIKVISNSSIASVYGDLLMLSDTGEFELKVFSVYDYTNPHRVYLLSMYYLQEFKVYNSLKTLSSGDVINILNGKRAIINTSTTSYANGIELVSNDFEVNFALYKDIEKENQIYGSYITNNTIGSHTINATWTDDITDLKYLYISIISEYDAKYNELIYENYVDGFYLVISPILGTSEIVVDKVNIDMEPKDAATVRAIITTDAVLIDGDGKKYTTDKITPSTISIIKSDGEDCTDKFDVIISENGTFVEDNKFSFDIEISLKMEYRHITNYVNQNYDIAIRSLGDGGEGEDVIYVCVASLSLTVKPQSISSINISTYLTTYPGGTYDNITKKTYFDAPKNLVSSLRPTDSAILEIDLFPKYASFDYLEIVSTSNTFAGFAYIVMEYSDDRYTAVGDGDIYYESIPNVNGIRLYNNFGLAGIDYADIGTYYLRIYTKNSLDQNAVITTSITPYYNGEIVDGAMSTLTYISVPKEPELNIDGKTFVYAYAGEELTVNVNISSDQDIQGGVYYVHGAEGDNILVDRSKISLKYLSSVGGYNQYTMTFKVPEIGPSFVLNEHTSHMRLFVQSYKIDRGERIPSNPSTLDIYVSEFAFGDNPVIIKDVNDGVIKISSVKYKELEILTNFVGDEEAISFFNSNYYYINANTNFEVGYYDSVHTYASTSGETGINLASWLYYIGDSGYNNVGIFNNGVFTPKISAEYGDYVSFIVEDGKLYVRGGDRKGEVPMLLTFYYTMPDGRQFTYDYYFTIENGIYTTEDMPLEVSDSSAFLSMNQSTEANDYILSSNIYLYEYEVMSDTSKIKSLDGNNYTVNIISFANQEGSSVDLALFKTISSTTTIKNLTVNYYYLDEMVFDNTVTVVNFAGLAITNSGIVYNTEVMAFETSEKAPTFNTYGLKITANNATITGAGFVINNDGSITNSRVGGTSKLATSFDYLTESAVMLPQKSAITAKQFTIKSAGTLSGFVNTNNGAIASSFAKNINIINTYTKNETMTTSGFVTVNSGDISMCYAEGGKALNTDINSNIGGIEGTGILSGFVYFNNGNISDSYSNVMLKTSNNQVGRLGSGFVYSNGEQGQIERAHSFSSIADNNTSQLNFIGVSDTMEYNDKGSVKNCYYYVADESGISATDTLYDTEIQPITNALSAMSFYGYNFGSSYNGQNVTWVMTVSGPSIVSANDITHSVRYKKNVGDVETSSPLDYEFIYVDEYDLGTANNPIIIRSAEEFNNVFSGNAGTAVNDNLSSNYKKAFGNYRLVSNIDLSSLIIDDGAPEKSEYFNLATTSVTLTGEYSLSSNRKGVFDGNGLTISGLAITNSSVEGVEYFGMFKEVVKGASINNLKVGLAKGGVSADRTMVVGAIAGKVEDSSLSNIYVYNQTPTEVVSVIGSHIVGGVAGIIAGNGYVSSIRVSNVSVTATYNISIANTEPVIKDNIPITQQGESINTTIQNLNRLSIAGGAFGIVHIYTQDQIAKDLLYDNLDIREANVLSVSVDGGMQINGMTVGGVLGYVGKYVVARDMSLTITKSPVLAKIVAYRCFAGGLIGINCGSLYQIKAEYESEWQKEIEQGIQTYYNGNLEFDRGQTDIFYDEELEYSPMAIGGLVGVMLTGYIGVAYSKINVANGNAGWYVGGVVGIIVKSNHTESDELAVEISEVYATGDVYAPNAKYVAGLVGLSEQDNISLDKVSALNMWSYESYGDIDNIIDTSENRHLISQIANILNENTKTTIGKNSSLNNTDNTVTFSGNGKKIKLMNYNADDNIITIAETQTIPSYYNYVGLNVDGGAQISPAFNNIDWYDSGNWTIKSGDLFPRIKYATTISVYEIWDRNDLWKIGRYGKNPEARFILMSTEPIDCGGWRTTYSILRGSIIGKHDKSGFKNLCVPLLSELNGATLSGIRFEGCKSPIAISSTGGTKFSNLVYSGCNFTGDQNKYSTYKVDSVEYANYAGVVRIIKGQTTFKAIWFDGETKFNIDNNNQNVINAGLLFAMSDNREDYDIDISGINVSSTCKISFNLYNNNINGYFGSNIGLLFGYSLTKKSIQVFNCNVSGKIVVNVDNLTKQKDNNIGYIGGYASESIVLKEVITKSTISADNDDISIITENNEQNACLNIGGFIGRCDGELKLDNSNVKATTNVGCDISLKGGYKSANIGGIVGQTKQFTYINPNNIVDGITNNSDVIYGLNIVNNSSKYCKIKVDTSNVSDANLNVGGIAGYVKENIDGSNDTNNKTLIYNGNIIINQVKNVVSNNRIFNIGGIVGYFDGDNSDKKLSYVSFAGTISFAGKEEQYDNYNYYNVGGIVGRNNGSNLTIDHAYSFGDILIAVDKDYYLNTHVDSYVGGIVGRTETDATLSYTVSIATLYGFHNNEKIHYDAIVGGMAGSITVTATDTYYASNLNLCVSDNTNAVNTTYYNLIQKDGSIVPDEIVSIFKNSETFEGGKLNPIEFEYVSESILNKSKYEITRKASIQTYSTKEEYDDGLRKLYVILETAGFGHELENNYTQIELQNTILFSDGGEIYTRATPFNKIDNKSAISGVISRIYVDDDDLYQAINNDAGFVNENDGIVYTCSARETFDRFSLSEIDSISGKKATENTLDRSTTFNDTVFYGVLSVNKRTSAIGGFVQNNYGYIFGSFSNMHISNLGGKTSVGGFVYLNNGVIDYCYASGYATTDTDSSFDIFAYNKGDGSAIKSTCYSLFAPFVSGNLSTESETINHFTQITNKGSVSYEADAIEYYFVGDTTNVDVLYGKTYTSGYYACKQDYNSNYPVLFNKFKGEELDYVRQSSYVYPHTTTANKSGLVNEYVYYNNNKVDTKFMIVPTATAFINMGSGASDASKNYVITRHMNFGYMGFNNENNSGSIKDTLEAGGSIISDLNFVNIDGQNHSIMNLQLGKCDEDGKPLQNGKNLIGVLDSNAKLYDLRFQNLTLYDSTGIIGENYGTITGVIIAGNINYAISTNNGRFGTLVGTNCGYVGTTKEIEDGAKAITATKAKSLYGCKINADSINGANSTAATYYFGGLVGQNVEDEDTSIVGIIKNITINLNNVRINEKLTSGGGYIVQNLYFGGALGLLAAGEVSNCVLETAKVLVVAGNEVVVGGIIAEGQGGIIAEGQEGKVYNCETKTNCTIQAGSEDDEMQDNVLITPGTQTSYIGGIVGIGPIDNSSGLSIYDCYNGADIYAKAVWNFSGETRQIENKYKGEDKAPVSVYIVKKGTSNANAGGIISNYLTASKVANEGGDIGGNVIATRLKNTGKVVGGFSAYKPVGVFCTKNNIDFLAEVAVGALGATAMSMAIKGGAEWAINNVIRFAKYVPVVRYLAYVAEIVYYTKKIIDWVVEQETAHLIYTPYKGNSNNYNSKYIYTNNNIKDSINVERIRAKKGFMGNVSSIAFDIEYKKLDSVERATLFDPMIALKYNESSDYCYQHGVGVLDNDDYKHKYTQLEDICFDGICPTIFTLGSIDSYSTKNVMISENNKRFIAYTKYFDENEEECLKIYDGTGVVDCYSLECDIGDEIANSTLLFTDTESFDYLNNNEYLKTFGWGDDDNLNVPWNTDGTLKIANPEILTPISGDGTDENPYRFILTDASLWKNLTYTINTVKQDVDVFKYQSINTQIDIQTGSTIGVFVGTDTFNKFNGKLTFKANSRLCGYKALLDGSVKDNTYGLGIIKESESAKVLNFMYVGKVEFAEDKSISNQVKEEKDINVSFGLVIGKVNYTQNHLADEYYDVYISGAVVDNCVLEVPDNVSDRLKNLSTLIGEANGSVSIKNANVNISRANIKGLIKDFESYSNDCTFGGVVGLVNSTSKTKIEDAQIIVNRLQIVSQINNAGGFVGKNLGNLTTNGVVANIEEFNIASYKNTSVGGILGYNKGSYAIEGSIFVGGIDELTTMLLSADVIRDVIEELPDEDTNRIVCAYAGGVVGYDEHNPTYLSETGSISLGNNGYAMVDGGYAIDKILSGYNSYNFNDIAPINNDSYLSDNNSINKYVPLISGAGELVGNYEKFRLDKSNVIVKNMVKVEPSGEPNATIAFTTDISFDGHVENNNWSGESITVGEFTYTDNEFEQDVTNNENYDFDVPPGYVIKGDTITTPDTYVFNGETKALEIVSKNTLSVSDLKTYYLWSANSNSQQVVNEFIITTKVEYSYGDESGESGELESKYKVRITSLMDGDFLFEVILISATGMGVFASDDYEEYNNSIIFSHKYSEIKSFIGNGSTIEIPNLNSCLTVKEAMQFVVEEGIIKKGEKANVVYSISNRLYSTGMYIEFVKDDDSNITGINFYESLQWENVVNGYIYDEIVESGGNAHPKNSASFNQIVRHSAKYTRTFAQIPISILAQNSYTFARSDVDINSAITDELSYDVEVYEDGIMRVNKQNLGMANGTNEATYTDSETTKLTYTLQKPKANFYDGENEYEQIYVYKGSYRGKNALIVSLRYEDIIKEKVYYYNGTNYALAAELSYNCPSFSDKKDIDGNYYYTERDANFIPVGAMGISTRYYNIDAGSYTITNILDGITYRVIEKTVYIIDVIRNGEVYEQNGDIVIDLGQTTYKEYGVSYYYTTNKVAVNP